MNSDGVMAQKCLLGSTSLIEVFEGGS